MRQSSRRAPIAAGLLALALATASAAAQPFPAFGGFEARIGSTGPEKGAAGFGAGADVDVGFVGTERLRAFAGLTYFVSDVERRTAVGARIAGAITTFGGRAGLRFDVPTPWRLTPFLLAQVGGYEVDAGEVDDAPTRELLDGFTVGAGIGGGLAYRWSQLGRSSVVLEARRVAANDLGHWAVELGFRYGPRDPAAEREAEAMERERRRIEAERARTRPPRPPPG